MRMAMELFFFSLVRFMTKKTNNIGFPFFFSLFALVVVVLMFFLLPALITYYSTACAFLL